MRKNHDYIDPEIYPEDAEIQFQINTSPYLLPLTVSADIYKKVKNTISSYREKSFDLVFDKFGKIMSKL
ncbi:hypothetical protein GF376_04050 [Candidatus Peregrinibacteria bacterium]|nr:hypothetical protein [Candidatus Peregrinibacteria bacterium]